jgi:hypothetical protein
MRRRAAPGGWVVAVVAALGLGVGGVAAASQGGLQGDVASPIAQAAATCGKPGAPPCPLQKWMRGNVAKPLSENDTAALAAGLEKTATLVPDPAWSSWGTLARSGAAAAKRGDTAGARAACKGCHDAWRSEYRAKFRLRPIPR